MLVPVAYLLIERRVRHRTWMELGLKRTGYLKDIVANWPIIMAVVFALQFVVVWVVGTYVPTFLQHIYSRIPWSPRAGTEALFGFLALVTFVTFVEELVYRGFVQEGVSCRYGNSIAAAASSLFMGLMHWAPGDLFAVALDLAFVFLDSFIYGLLYVRTRSVLVSWTAHLSVDLFDIALMLQM